MGKRPRKTDQRSEAAGTEEAQSQPGLGEDKEWKACLLVGISGNLSTARKSAANIGANAEAMKRAAFAPPPALPPPSAPSGSAPAAAAGTPAQQALAKPAAPERRAWTTEITRESAAVCTREQGKTGKESAKRNEER